MTYHAVGLVSTKNLTFSPHSIVPINKRQKKVRIQGTSIYRLYLFDLDACGFYTSCLDLNKMSLHRRLMVLYLNKTTSFAFLVLLVEVK